ncbi:MAG: flavin reductase family protein [Candidatus Bathyarchaeota archaeon]|nr:flavin reductase family protein [Candidatus Bathyarchaeota archaeon]
MNIKALHFISYGLYVVTSIKDGKFNGQVANTVFQVTSKPVTVAACINKQNLTHSYIDSSRVFAASVLSKETPLSFIGQFGFRSGKDVDKLKNVNFKIGKTGVPIVLDYSLAWVEAKVTGKFDVNSHTIFVGEVVDSDIIMDGEPMTYAYYHLIKGGGVPKTAPTHIGG